MSSFEICSIMKKAILSHYQKCEVISIPVADGGEGTVDAFLEAVGGDKTLKEVSGPYYDEKQKGITPSFATTRESSKWWPLFPFRWVGIIRTHHSQLHTER